MSEEKDQTGPGNPPKAKRFTKGTSGNPRGRPRGVKNRKTVLTEIGARRQSMKVNGTRLDLSTAETLIHLLHVAAIAGDARALNAMARYRQYLMPETAADEGTLHIVSVEAPETIEELKPFLEDYRMVMLREKAKFEEELRGNDDED